MKDFHDYNLLSNNTFGINAKCRRFVEFSSVEDLQDVVNSLKKDDYPLLIIGGGSNLLLTKDYEGTVLHSVIYGYETKNAGDDVLLRAGSGETWDEMVALCVKNGWYGLENLSLIPGEVGASAVQNIGAYGVEAKDTIVSVEAVEISTGEKVKFSNSDCDYSYRRSRFKGEWRDKYIITYVTYKLSKKFVPHLDYGNIRSEMEKQGIVNPTAEQLRHIIINIRNEKLPDPKVEGNAGSFFMNPIVSRSRFEQLSSEYPDMPQYIVDEDNVKIPASWMSDRGGWKGRTLGKAGVYAKQALVLVNKGGASGTDVVLLSDTIRKDVKFKFGIEIFPEVNIK